MIDFPTSPVDGQIYTYGTTSWVYSSAVSAWDLVATTVIGPTGPTGPSGGPTGPTGAAGQWDTAQIIDNKTASYTLLTADAGKLITMTVASANNVTVDSSLDLSVGQRIDIAQMGTGQTTVVASGTTVVATPTLKLRTQYSSASLICTATDTYLLVGDLAVS